MRAHKTTGFTLIELSLVLVILSVIGAGLLSATTQNVRRAKQAEMKTKLAAIEQAFVSFRQRNNRLPCPADGTLLLSNPAFGTEAGAPGACASANFSDGANTVGGALPTKALGLPNDIMFDPWGGRFTYAVDVRITGINAFTNYLVNNTAIGSIEIDDYAANPRTTAAVMAIISHGPNGHGAFQISGARKFNGSTNAAEWQNCHCNAAAATAFDNKFIQQAVNATDSSNSFTTFDDTVMYYLRGWFTTANDVNGV